MIILPRSHRHEFPYERPYEIVPAEAAHDVAPGQPLSWPSLKLENSDWDAFDGAGALIITHREDSKEDYARNTDLRTRIFAAEKLALTGGLDCVCLTNITLVSDQIHPVTLTFHDYCTDATVQLALDHPRNLFRTHVQGLGPNGPAGHLIVTYGEAITERLNCGVYVCEDTGDAIREISFALRSDDQLNVHNSGSSFALVTEYDATPDDVRNADNRPSYLRHTVPHYVTLDKQRRARLKRRQTT